MRHLITTSDFTKNEILELFDNARIFKNLHSNEYFKNRLIVNLFFENSTRTRTSFEIASKRLGAQVTSLDVGNSSRSKGETIFDTVSTINAMKPDAIIIRHSEKGLPQSLTKNINCPILNAGDGANAHPTQAFLDLFTIMEHFNLDVEGKKIAIVGDVKTSRVAASNLKLLPRFGIEPIIVAPDHFKLLNSNIRQVSLLKEVIDEVHIVMSLRTQLERHSEVYYTSMKEYAKDYCITKEMFGQRDLLLLHPGPVNRNIDIEDEMLLDPRNKILEQVTNGVAIRMAVLKKLIK